MYLKLSQEARPARMRIATHSSASVMKYVLEHEPAQHIPVYTTA